MINFRQLFNPSYSMIGLFAIFLLIVLIFLNNHNHSTSFHLVGKSILIAGIIGLLSASIMNVITNMIIPYNYQIFVQVISKNFFKNLLLFSNISLIIGLLFLQLAKFLLKN